MATRGAARAGTSRSGWPRRRCRAGRRRAAAAPPRPPCRRRRRCPAAEERRRRGRPPRAGCARRRGCWRRRRGGVRRGAASPRAAPPSRSRGRCSDSVSDRSPGMPARWIDRVGADLAHDGLGRRGVGEVGREVSALAGQVDADDLVPPRRQAGADHAPDRAGCAGQRGSSGVAPSRTRRFSSSASSSSSDSSAPRSRRSRRIVVFGVVVGSSSELVVGLVLVVGVSPRCSGPRGRVNGASPFSSYSSLSVNMPRSVSKVRSVLSTSTLSGRLSGSRRRSRSSSMSCLVSSSGSLSGSMPRLRPARSSVSTPPSSRMLPPSSLAAVVLLVACRSRRPRRPLSASPAVAAVRPPYGHRTVNDASRGSGLSTAAVPTRRGSAAEVGAAGPAAQGRDVVVGGVGRLGGVGDDAEVASPTGRPPSKASST